MLNQTSKLSKLYLFVMFVILYLPIMYLIIFSFNAGGDMSEFTGFTLDHYVSVISDKRLLTFIINTFLVALLSALLATIIGTMGALTIHQKRGSRQQSTLLNLNNILMVTPDVMIGALFLILFSSLLPLQLGFWTVLSAHVAFSIPIVVLMVLPRLYEMNPNLVTAAQDLGASDWQILTKVVLPSIGQGIISAFFMAFTYSLDDFAVTFFVTGNGFSTISVEVYSRVRRGISLEINALSTLMFLVSLSLALGYYYLQRSEARRKGMRGGQR
ncbi:ABC transporter permease [Hutsoniella sourekii]